MSDINYMGASMFKHYLKKRTVGLVSAFTAAAMLANVAFTNPRQLNADFNVPEFVYASSNSSFVIMNWFSFFV